MRKFTTFCLIIFASALIVLGAASIIRAQEDQSHVKWVGDSLKEMETIKAGMTRADLLKVFMEEGGLSTRNSRNYVYRKCPLFKVTVEFKSVGEQSGFPEDPKDVITKISTPFLQWIVID